MAFVEPSNADVKALRGLHLYHAGRSNCSGRVRLLILEKRLPWTSHHVDIYTRANVTAEYFGINPKGLVPTLVHDGRVIAESNDILLYLEDAFPTPGFTPQGAPDQALMRGWLQRSGDIHMPGIKTYAYAKSHAANVAKTPETAALYRSLQKDPALLTFHAKHDTPGRSFSEEDVASASALLIAAFAEMDAILAREGWLVGRAYSLADISWAPTIATLKGVGFPVDDFTHVMDWYARIGERPAFQRAIAAWRADPVPGVTEMAPGA